MKMSKQLTAYGINLSPTLIRALEEKQINYHTEKSEEQLFKLANESKNNLCFIPLQFFKQELPPTCNIIAIGENSSTQDNIKSLQIAFTPDQKQAKLIVSFICILQIISEREDIPIELFTSYLTTIIGRIRELKAFIFEKEKNRDYLEKIRFHIHKSAGTGSTFGFPQITTLCKEWEIKIDDALSHDDFEKTYHDLAQIYEDYLKGYMNFSLESSMFQQKSLNPAKEDKQATTDQTLDLFVIDDDESILQTLTQEAKKQGLSIETQSSFIKGKERIIDDSFNPKIVLIDLMNNQEKLTGYDIIEAYKEKYPHYRTSLIGILSAKGEISSRAKSYDLGVDVYFQKPLDCNRIFYVLKKLLYEPKDQNQLILMIDDDQDLCSMAKEALKNSSYQLEAIHNEHELFEAIEQYNPQLILLDYYLNEVNGIELLKAIKSDAKYRRFPVVMLTRDQSPEVIREAFKAGAIDYLFKPLDAQQFPFQIKSILKKNYQMDVFFEKDIEYGFYNRQALEELFITYQLKYPSALIAVLEIACSDEIPIEQSRKLINEFGQHLFALISTRNMLAKWDNTKFVLIITDYKTQELKDILENITKQLYQELFESESSSPITINIAILLFPDDGNELSEIVEKSQDLIKKIDNKRSKIHIVTSAIAQEDLKRFEHKKVAIISHDSSLLNILNYTFILRSIEAYPISSAKEALEWAKKSYLSSPPDLIILDAQIDTDPIMLIHRLHSYFGRSVDILYLSPYSNEQNIHFGIQAGASSYYTKPFNLNLFMKKIESILNI